MSRPSRARSPVPLISFWRAMLAVGSFSGDAVHLSRATMHCRHAVPFAEGYNVSMKRKHVAKGAQPSCCGRLFVRFWRNAWLTEANADGAPHRSHSAYVGEVWGPSEIAGVFARRELTSGLSPTFLSDSGGWDSTLFGIRLCSVSLRIGPSSSSTPLAFASRTSPPTATLLHHVQRIQRSREQQGRLPQRGWSFPRSYVVLDGPLRASSWQLTYFTIRQHHSWRVSAARPGPSSPDALHLASSSVWGPRDFVFELRLAIGCGWGTREELIRRVESSAVSLLPSFSDPAVH